MKLEITIRLDGTVSVGISSVGIAGTSDEIKARRQLEAMLEMLAGIGILPTSGIEKHVHEEEEMYEQTH